MDSFDKLMEWFASCGGTAVVALSGGVDSAVVAIADNKAL
jgi:PP-loop superfamily ATP-utilizing enzyme